MSVVQQFAQVTTDYTTDAAAAGISGVLVLFWLALVVVAIVGLWKVFTKAGKPGWAAIIPLYNTWVLAEIAGRPGWFGLVAVLINFIPIVGWIVSLVMLVLIAMDVAVKFGKSKAFGIIGLFLFSIIGFLILGFGKDKYDASIPTDTPQFGTNTPSAGGTSQTPPAAKPQA